MDQERGQSGPPPLILLSASKPQKSRALPRSKKALLLTDGGGLTVQDINSEVGIFFEYTGQLNYLGTNGEGMVFRREIPTGSCSPRR